MEGVVGEDRIANQGDTQVGGREVDQQPVKRRAELKNSLLFYFILTPTKCQFDFQSTFVILL